MLCFYVILTDYVCVLYGTPSVYGVVTMPFSVLEGINVFLAGFVPTENLRFREEELNFKLAANFDTDSKQLQLYSYPSMTKTMCEEAVITPESKVFKLHVEGGWYFNISLKRLLLLLFSLVNCCYYFRNFYRL